MEHVEQDIDESLTQQEIFNRLTDNGAAQGLLLYNGQLYINASYINAGYLNANHIQGGTLTLGGQNNQNGVLRVLDASGNVITVLNNAGADITNGSLTTYSTDRQTRTILSDGLLKFQFYNSAAQPIGWLDALRLAADSQSATIGTFAGIAELDISGRGRVKIKNKDSTTDPDYAEIDMDDDSVLLTATRNDSGVMEWASLQVTKDGVTVSKQGSIGDPYVLFELAAGQSSKPLSVGNGGTGATTPAAARANLGITPANIGAENTIVTNYSISDFSAVYLQPYEGRLWAVKKGSMVYLFYAVFNGYNGSEYSANTLTSLFMLPPALRPIIVMPGVPMIVTNGITTPIGYGYADINSNGIVQMIVNAVGYAQLCVTYIAGN
jgi:hypothetical protein